MFKYRVAFYSAKGNTFVVYKNEGTTIIGIIYLDGNELSNTTT